MEDEPFDIEEVDQTVCIGLIDLLSNFHSGSKQKRRSGKWLLFGTSC